MLRYNINIKQNMEKNMISKKDLLNEMKISYGQLYRWKREGLIPDEWFIKQSVSTGQETYFKRDLIIPRIKKILELKDSYQLDELKSFLNPNLSEREFSLRDIILIDEIDPFILKYYSKNKEVFSIYDVIIIYIFSLYKDLVDYNKYINYDFSKINSINSNQRKKKLSCRPMLEFVCLLYVYNLVVSDKVKYHRIKELKDLFFKRMHTLIPTTIYI